MRYIIDFAARSAAAPPALAEGAGGRLRPGSRHREAPPGPVGLLFFTRLLGVGLLGCSVPVDLSTS